MLYKWGLDTLLMNSFALLASGLKAGWWVLADRLKGEWCMICCLRIFSFFLEWGCSVSAGMVCVLLSDLLLAGQQMPACRSMV